MYKLITDKLWLQDKKPTRPRLGHAHDLIVHVAAEFWTGIHIDQVGGGKGLLSNCILRQCFCIFLLRCEVTGQSRD